MDLDSDAEEDAAGTTGPAVVASDRTVDDDDLDALLDADELARLADQRLDTASGGDLARDYQRQLGLPPSGAADDEAAVGEDSSDDSEEASEADEPESEPDAEAADEEEAQEEAERPASDGESTLTPQQVPEIITRDGQPLEDAVAQDLARCLDEVLAAQPDAIPVYAELVTFEGQDAVAFGLLTEQADTGAFTRREVWALDLASCRTLRFSQLGDDGR